MSNICFACGNSIPPSSAGFKVKYNDQDILICYSCNKESTKTNLAAFISEMIKRKEMGQAEIEKLKQEKQERIELFNNIILTTSSSIDGKPITEYKAIIGAQVMAGINIFKDLFAGIRDIVGGRSEALQKSMKQMRNQALQELKEEAAAVGANAIISVRLDFDEYGGNMLMLTASGTAVVIS